MSFLYYLNRILLILTLSLNLVVSQENESSILIKLTNESSDILDGANIILINQKDENTKYSGATDSKGEYYLTNILPGEYSIEISFIGYLSFLDTIQIENDYVDLDVTLDISPITISELEIISDASMVSMVGTSTSIDAGTLKSISPLGTQEILEYVPGINGFSDDGLGNSRINIGIRGINPRRSSRVLVLEDGVPIQPAIYVYPNMYYNPPVERINEVEVIKGSSTIIYGPQTMGGVINYLTTRPRKGNRPNFKLTGGNNGYLSMFLETGTLLASKINPEIQFLYKQGDGFRQNNEFIQYNTTFKMSYNKSRTENIYLKANLNYENSNATYTGLTLHTFENNPDFNPKEYDNFELFRFSTDLIHTKVLNKNLTSTATAFISYFDRNWWREDDIFINTAYIGSENPNGLGYNSTAPSLTRVGNQKSSSGRLRSFYVAGTEVKYDFKDMFIPFNNRLNIGARLYFERFIDDGKKGYSPDSRDGYYYLEAEQFLDCGYNSGGDYLCEGDAGWDPSYGNGSYDLYVVQKNPDTQEYDMITSTPEPFIDCSLDNPELCEGMDGWSDGMGDGKWTDNKIVGQSHHYESQAFAGFISQSIELDSNPGRKLIIEPGLRLELFEQERVDRLTGATYQDKTSFVVLPGIGFNKQVDNLNFFGGIHRGFTPPSSGSIKILNFGDNDGSDALELKAETSWNKEVGFRMSSDIIHDLELAFFHININNMVAAGRSIDFKNLGKIQSMGLELATNIYLSLFDFLKPMLHLNYSYLSTEVTDATIMSNIPPEYFGIHPDIDCVEFSYDVNGVAIDCKRDISGNKLPYSPEHTLMLGMSINILDKIETRFDYKYISQVFTDFENIESNNTFCLTNLECQDESKIDFSKEYKVGIAGPVPEYGVANLSFKYNINPKISTTLTVKNLFDLIYIGSRLHSSPGVKTATTSTGIIPGARRQINLDIEYNF